MTSEKKQIVTIDGPAGVGKSTVSLLVAEAVDFFILDTGAMYRAVGFYLKETDIDLQNNKAVAASLDAVNLEIFPAENKESYTKVILNNREITDLIRSPEMSMMASRVSALEPVRTFLTKLQRRYGEKGRIVAEGRDMGSVVFPDAAWKFYLDADPKERAQRRCLQLTQKGEQVDYKEMLAQILQRDKNDSSRTIAPLRKAEDAVLIDTTHQTIEQVVTMIIAVMQS